VPFLGLIAILISLATSMQTAQKVNIPACVQVEIGFTFVTVTIVIRPGNENLPKWRFSGLMRKCRLTNDLS
jgi:hypothetical protein